MTSLRVLCVEDNDLVREMTCEMLSDGARQITAVATGEEALNVFRQQPFDLVMTDVSLPGMSGLDLQRELARRRQEIPVVFITAQGDESVHRRALDQGAAAVLSKPFSDTALLEALKAALRING